MPVLDYGAARCLSSERVAELLEEIAELLEAQDANPFRVRAYRFAADTVRGLPRPVSDVVEHEGAEGLRRIHGVGESLSRSIEQLARTGHLGLLDVEAPEARDFAPQFPAVAGSKLTGGLAEGSQQQLFLSRDELG